jgi:hypothetical protein
MGEDPLELFEWLTAWCDAQPGIVTWTLKTTHDNGKRGVQLYVYDHLSEFYVWSVNAPTLLALSERLADWKRTR